MFLDVIRSPGLSHLSYLIGDDTAAAVVDPRHDLDEYLTRARERGVRIALVFETHRNEDLVSGARALAEATGARVLHGQALDFAYGEGAAHGHEERLGDLRLVVLHTPGHTDESISIACYDAAAAPDGPGAAAVGVFTGDALFVGDVGRTDFYPDRAEQVAGALYDSIFEQLLPLGDQALLWPAHGAGSVCGEGMASREFSTLGHERKTNPMLQRARDDFVRHKVAEQHTKPPYFREMERRNLRGAERLPALPEPTAHGPGDLERALADGAQLVDVRSPEAYAGCAIPRSLALPVDMLAGYAGWLLSYDAPIVLVAEGEPQREESIRQLVRLGYTRITGYLSGGVRAWAVTGRPLQSVPLRSAAQLKQDVERDATVTVLDVRKPTEWQRGHLPGAEHRFLGDLPAADGLAELPTPLVTFCGSGRRALVAASLLRRAGHRDVEVCFGSLQACEAIGCTLTEED